ncbi:MAG TPA: hypothetical protein V6D17_00890 [Candidatus Obscuribacterales bacterium]
MLSHHSELFGKYDIRGKVSEGLDESFARELGLAFASFLSPEKCGRFLVGHDVRAHSALLSSAFVEGILDSGSDVVELGMSSTPRITLVSAMNGFDGSASVTASHLAPPFHGFKLFGKQALPLGSDGTLSVLLSHKAETTSTRGRRIAFADLAALDLASYVQTILAKVRLERPLRVAIDPGHGAMCEEVRQLKDCLSEQHEVILLHEEPDAGFPNRPPNPLEDGALDGLRNCVLERGLDFGVAFDGDGDRAIFVDEQGRMVPTDHITGLLAGKFARQNQGCTVAFDFRSTRAVRELATEYGAACLPVAVGYPVIIGAMRSRGAVFAGELSGHYYYSDLFCTDNGLRTFVEVAGEVSCSGRSLSQLLRPMKKYVTSGEINLEVRDAAQILERLETAFKSGEVRKLDGLSVNFHDWSFSARQSRTEPVLRLTVEAHNEETLKRCTEELLREVRLDV